MLWCTATAASRVWPNSTRGIFFARGADVVTVQRTASEASTYNGDFHAWTAEQAALLRAGRLAEADIAEEIEDLGRAVRRDYFSWACKYSFERVLDENFWPDLD